MPKILVTGGAGYIGSHTIIELLEAGFEVVSVDNYSNSAPETYDRIASITGQRFPIYEIDLTDEVKTRKLFADHSDIDGIIHFAALKSVPDSVERPLEYYNNNNGSLTVMLELAEEFGVKAFIFSSSCSVYGNVDKSLLPVVEETPLGKAECPYANTKQMGEQIIEAFCQSGAAMKHIALRYFNPVGAHPSGLNGEMPSKVVNNLVPLITQAAAKLRGALTVFGDDYDTRDGSAIRDYIHVVDIADAHVKALQYLLQKSDAPQFDIINLGTGDGVSVLEAIKAFEKVNGVPVPFEIGPRRDGDVEAIYSNPQKADRVLGWKTQFGIDEMMRSAWKWQLKLMED